MEAAARAAAVAGLLDQNRSRAIEIVRDAEADKEQDGEEKRTKTVTKPYTLTRPRPQSATARKDP